MIDIIFAFVLGAMAGGFIMLLVLACIIVGGDHYVDSDM